MSQDCQATIRAVEAIGRKWNEAEINYAVTTQLERCPEEAFRDVKVVIERRHCIEARDALVSVLEQRGWRVVTRRRGEHLQCLAFHQSGTSSLIVNLVAGLQWGCVPLIERPAPTERAGVFKVDPWASFVSRVLLLLLTTPRPDLFKDLARLCPSASEYTAASARLPEILGTALTHRLLNAIQNRGLHGLATISLQVRRALILSSVRRHPLRSLKTAWRWASVGVANVAARPFLPIICIVGPDGVGKSSVLDEVMRQAAARICCTSIEARHWRPGILPQLGKFIGRAAPSGPRPPRRTAGAFGWLRAAYYSADYVLGYYLRDRRVSADLGLVLYDRCILDMIVDPVRYGISSNLAVRFLWRYLPKPGLVVLLHDDVARIRMRKAELDEEEIARQLSVWMELAAAGEVQMVLGVTDSPAALARQILDRLVNALH
jgi:hypothetical protein